MEMQNLNDPVTQIGKQQDCRTTEAAMKTEGVGCPAAEEIRTDENRRWYSTMNFGIFRNVFLKGRLTYMGGIAVEEIEGFDPSERVLLRLDDVSVITVFDCDDDSVERFGSDTGDPWQILKTIEYLFGRKIYDQDEVGRLASELFEGGFDDDVMVFFNTEEEKREFWRWRAHFNRPLVTFELTLQKVKERFAISIQ